MSQENRGIAEFTAGAAITQYQQVKIDSSRTAQVCGAGDTPDGRAEIAADSGKPVSVRLHNFPGTRKVILNGACNVGDTLYTAASGKLSTTPSTGPGVFKALEAATADGDVIEALPVDSVVGGSALVGSNSAGPATALGSTNTEVAYDKKATIPASSLQVGDVLDIEGEVLVTGKNASETLNLKLYVGGTGGQLIAATGAVNVAVNDVGKIRAKLVVQAVGASGKYTGGGETALGTPGSVDEKAFALAQVTQDTTAALDVVVSATWSGANSANLAVLEALSVIRHRP